MRRLILACLWATTASAQTPPTNVRMQNVVKAFTQRTGQQLIGLGSWISGLNYKDVLDKGASDHDLRLVLQKSGVTPAQAQREWQAARRVLRDLIAQEFGKDAQKVLGATNLYAPNQLMKGVEDAADAMQRFERLGQVPNMGYTGTVNASTPQHLAEGLYGEGSQLWTQMYEQKSGRLFYAIDGKAYAGMVDLTHLAEGRGPYSVSGMANTSAQWAEKAAEELSLNRGDRVAKYLQRLERDMAKAKDLARLGGDPSWTSEIRDLASRLKANPRSLTQLEGRVAALLQRSHLESAILGRLAKAGPVQGAVLSAAMAGIAAKNQFGQALSNAVQKIPAEQVIQGVMAIIIVTTGSRAAGESGYMEALRQTAPMMASLGTGALMGLTNAIMDGAKEGGFALAASYQDPWDLLDGNFSAAGRVSVDEGRPYTLEELVRSIHTEDALSNFVRTRSMQASQRGFQGAVSAGTDKSVADGIYARCYPQILRAWQARREQLRMEYLDLADSLRAAVYPLAVSPSSAKLTKGGKVDVLAEVIPPSSSTLGRSLDRMKDILTILAGGRPYALVSYRWVGGDEGNRESQRRYTFRSAGTQSVVCNVEISVNESSLRAGDPLIQRIPRFTAVDVEIAGEVAVPEVEVHAFRLALRLEPPNSQMDLGPLAKTINYFDWPDFIDERGLTLAPDGSFSYSGRPYFDKDAAPGTLVYNPVRWHIEYSGRVDLEKWLFTVNGKWSKNRKNLTSKGETVSAQQDNGEFIVSAPLCARGHEEFAGLVKIKGVVSTSYTDPKNGGFAKRAPLATRSRRRITDDVHGCAAYRNPEYLNPEFKNSGGPETYEAGENLEREQYAKYKGMLVFGNHVVDKSRFRFARNLIMPGTPGWAALNASAAGNTQGPAGAAPGAFAGATTPRPDDRPVNAPMPARTPEPTPAPASTSFSVDSPTLPASTLPGQGMMDSRFVTLSNEGKTHWTRCVITVPGRRSFSSGTLPALTGRDYPIAQFKPDSNSPDLRGEALVRCREGSLRFPVNVDAPGVDESGVAPAGPNRMR